MDNTHLSFDKAYHRLEEILDVLNSEQLPLEEAVKIYEEADKLMHICQDKLTQAEQKVQVLIKNRNQEIVLQDNQEPAMEEFNPSKQQHLNRSLFS